MPPKGSGKKSLGRILKSPGSGDKDTVNCIEFGPGEYEVERVIHHTKLGNENFYFAVRWRGYPPSMVTYEPLENLEHASLKLLEYLEATNLQLRTDLETGKLTVVEMPLKSAPKKFPTHHSDNSTRAKSLPRKSVDGYEMKKRRGRPPLRTSTDRESPPMRRAKSELAGAISRRPDSGKKPSFVRRGAHKSSLENVQSKKPAKRGRSRSSSRIGGGLRRKKPPQEASPEPTMATPVQAGTWSAASSERQSEEIAERVPHWSGAGSGASTSWTLNGSERDRSLKNDSNVKPRPQGFLKGWVPEKIVGIDGVKKPLRYVVKWQGSHIVEAIDGRILLKEMPDLLMDFLESRIIGEA